MKSVPIRWFVVELLFDVWCLCVCVYLCLIVRPPTLKCLKAKHLRLKSICRINTIRHGIVHLSDIRKCECVSKWYAALHRNPSWIIKHLMRILMKTIWDRIVWCWFNCVLLSCCVVGWCSYDFHWFPFEPFFFFTLVVRSRMVARIHIQNLST